MNGATEAMMYEEATQDGQDGDKSKRAQAWTTEAEIDFINSIGDRIWPANVPRPEGLRKSVLIGRYIESASRRVDWFGIDSGKALAHAFKRKVYEAQVEKEQEWRQ